MTHRPQNTTAHKARISRSTVLPSKCGIFSFAALAASTIVSGSSAAQVASPNMARISHGSSAFQLAAREEEFPASSSEALSQIKLLAGLNWAQIALIIGVSRKTVYDWTNGGNAHSGNAAAIQALYARVKSFGDIPKFKVRAKLLEGHEKATLRRELPAIEGGPIPYSDHRRAKKPLATSDTSSMPISR